MSASPVTSPTTPNRSESLLEYLGTIGRRKKIKEGNVIFGAVRSSETRQQLSTYSRAFIDLVEELQEEGRTAIDGTALSPAIDNLPEEFVLGMCLDSSDYSPPESEQFFRQTIGLLLVFVLVLTDRYFTFQRNMKSAQ